MNNNSNMLQSFKSAYVIPESIPCVNCLNNILIVNDTYHLLDFEDDGRIKLHTVKFLTANLDEKTFSITVLDIMKDKLLTRIYPITESDIACHWMILEPDVLNTNFGSNITSK